MKFTAIPQLARNANRLREVITILSKYGLADWISRLDLDFAKGLFKSPEGSQLADLTREQRIRMALGELGPTFIKLGQILSTRADIIGQDLADELSQLQADAPADLPPVVRQTIERELARPLEEVFLEFHDLPLASASIGQVHRARLLDGTAVVVKVQHSGIEDKVRNDLEILVELADLAEVHLTELKNYRPRQTAADLQRSLRRELDFGREERNLLKFRALFAKDSTVHFPMPFPEWSTSRVLVMEYLEGIPVANAEALRASGNDLPALARHGAEVFLKMIFEHGFYHADPHPGNVLVLSGGVLGLIDSGMVGRIDESTREQIEDMLASLASRDANRLARVITRIGVVPGDLDLVALEYDVNEFVSHYADQPLNQFDLGGALSEMTEIIRRYNIVLPAGVALLIKVLIMLEGTSRLLEPNFNLTELIEPYQRKLILRRMSPRRQWKKLQRTFSEWQHLAEVLPRGVAEILTQVQSGKFEVHLQHKSLEPSVNRLVFGMLTSALFLGSAWLWANHVPPVIGEVPIFGVMGCTMAVFLGLRLMRAIAKSGHLDQRD